MAKWCYETLVEHDGIVHRSGAVTCGSKEEGQKNGAKGVRAWYKTCWSTVVIDQTYSVATVYTDGAGIVGYVNVWSES